jgi:hypothetical protein
MWTSHSEISGGRGQVCDRAGIARRRLCRGPARNVRRRDAGWRSFFLSLADARLRPSGAGNPPPLAAAGGVSRLSFASTRSCLCGRTRRCVAEHFQAAPKLGAVRFTNLGRDAVLIAPLPGGPHPPSAPGGVLLRGAGTARLVPTCRGGARRRLGASRWLIPGSRRGLAARAAGDRPKYYSHAPYRQGEDQRMTTDQRFVFERFPAVAISSDWIAASVGERRIRCG